jgi:hypothetical protein
VVSDRTVTEIGYSEKTMIEFHDQRLSYCVREQEEIYIGRVCERQRRGYMTDNFISGLGEKASLCLAVFRLRPVVRLIAAA